MPRLLKISSRLSVLPLILLLAGCNMVVMAPSGDIAVQQRDLIIVSTVLMLLIIVPVIFLTLFFAWRYRQSNTEATYDPDWHHSTRLEVVIWSAPLAIIIALGAVTWISTHQLDPYRPLGRLDSERTVPADAKPLNVEVVALDWKWLFFYPDLGIATVNELAAPVDTPINFKITASSVMNSFYIPALAGQIYAMPGMQTQLHAVINHPGEFEGLSANYSGPGFSGMHFKFHGLSQADFDQWVQNAKTQGTPLSRDAYLKLEKPSQNEPARYYASFDNGLYNAILNLCATPGKMCMNEMMHIDMMGGAGKESHENRERLIQDAAPIDEFGSPNQERYFGPEASVQSDDAPKAETAHDMPMSHSDMSSMPGMDMSGGDHAHPSNSN
ncbi:ubiquinol oxidase subunit II [Rhizobium sp. P32RR-XVIII]|uniref:ubiquinol oxidase subunit II n=1 Tax=Rhizobium sp. P32RR-XVIII TaxID=2726738 RepID=UPI00145796D4|nr:ubiquinol oxidase subunit II [Rhizobium sp. P32RR-XVIII]NLS07386.1 ubiquinol oxidase subunit II [Rhizobium sp. P32RR-XVIII]